MTDPETVPNTSEAAPADRAHEEQARYAGFGRLISSAVEQGFIVTVERMGELILTRKPQALRDSEDE